MTAAVARQDNGLTEGIRVPAVWYLLAWLAVAIVTFHDGDVFRRWFLNPPDAGFIGARFESTACGYDGFCRMRAVAPGSPLSAAGVREGDEFRLDHPADVARLFHPGEHIGLSLRRGETSSHLEIVATPSPATPFSFEQLAIGFAYVLPLLVGVPVLALSRGRLPTFLLANAFITMGFVGTYPTLLESLPGLFPWPSVPIFLLNVGPTPFFLAFALAVRRNHPAGRLLWIAAVICVGARGLCLLAEIYELFTGPTRAGPGIFVADVAVCDLSFLLTAVILAGGWLKSTGEQRTRYAFMLVAISLTIMLQGLGTVVNMTGNDWHLTNPVVAALVIAGIAGPLIFAYAVLRHRVIDLGFAVSQTLVYGVVSFVVLLLFGLAEWGMEKALPLEWREHLEANAFISAAIALCIFLIFHRIRDAVEHVIEGVFFHKWRANEAKLEQFVKQAAHIVKPDALRAAAITEFARFSGGAEVALYRADRTAFVRDAGDIAGLGATLDVDMPSLVGIRAEGKMLFDAEAEPLHAALVLPMIQRNELIGFIAVGPKPSGDIWRPDERKALGDAAQKIGLDLHAMQIEELREANAELSARLRQSDHQLLLVTSHQPA